MVYKIECKWPYSRCFVGAASCMCSKQHQHPYVAFYASVLLDSTRYIHTLVHYLEVIPFYFIRQIWFSYDRRSVSNRPLLPNKYGFITFSRWDIAASVCELSTNFRGLPNKVETIPCLNHRKSLSSVFTKRPMTCCLLHARQQGFSFGGCISEKR